MHLSIGLCSCCYYYYYLYPAKVSFLLHTIKFICVFYSTRLLLIPPQQENLITMFLERIRTLCSKRPGGVKGLAAEVDMSDVNLFRCIREGSIKAQDLERIAKALNVSITEFFLMTSLTYLLVTMQFPRSMVTTLLFPVPLTWQRKMKNSVLALHNWRSI